MAKKKAPGLTVEDLEREPEHQPVTREAKAQPEISLSVPLAEIDLDAYCPRHVDVQLDARQGRIVRRLLTALDGRGERLANGRRVNYRADAVRWLLERLADAIDACPS